MKKLVVILFVLIAGMQLQAQVNPENMSATAKAQFQAALEIKDSTWIDAYIKSLPGYVETSATATELNILDGALASTAEVNYLVGVTSNIQTQLDAKVANTDLDTIDGGLYNKAEIDAKIDSLATVLRAELGSGTTYTTEYQQLYDSLTVKPSATIAGYQNAFVDSAKAHGYWSKLDILYVFAQTSNDNGEALFNWVDPTSFKATNNGATFTALEGFTGDGSTAYLDLNYNPATEGVNYTLNSATIGAYTRLELDETGAIIGNTFAGNYIMYRPRSSGSMGVRLNGSSSIIANTVASSQGFGAAVRTSSSNITLYHNGSSIGDNSSTSTSIPSLNLYALDVNGESKSSNNQASMIFIGATLTAQEISDLNTDFETYMDAIGKGVIP